MTKWDKKGKNVTHYIKQSPYLDWNGFYDQLTQANL